MRQSPANRILILIKTDGPQLAAEPHPEGTAGFNRSRRTDRKSVV